MENCYSKISAYVPVVLPHIIERDRHIKKFVGALQEFVKLANSLDIEYNNEYKSSLSVYYQKKLDQTQNFKKVWEGKPSPWWDFWFIEFSSEFKFTTDDVETDIGDFFGNPISVKKDLYIHIASEKVHKKINDLLLALSVAKCGFITTSRGAIFTGDILRTTIRGTHNLFYEAYEVARKNTWPQLHDIDLQKVWCWLNSSDFFQDSIGVGPIGRAIAAITYLLKDTFIDVTTNISMDIIWILLGLEALYGKGNVGLKTQLIEKAQTFLGKPLKNKKRFGSVYDLRSRVIHGDIDIPFYYCVQEGLPKYEKLSSDLGDARLVALSVLLSSIQKLIIENKKDLEFKYQVL
jgi:hypothetical protein